jgi:mycofactocin system glycosyltransferase
MKPPKPALPDGFVVRLGRRTRVTDDGRALIGGAPTRVIYLTNRARDMVKDRTITVADAGTRMLADRLLEAGMADPVLGSLPEGDESQVTFVIPVFGRPAALSRLLDSIGPGRTVIIVDDVSPDPGPIARIAAAYGARLVVRAVNGGPAPVRNDGQRLATTRYVAFVDSDIVVEPTAVAKLIRHFADPRVALVAPRVLGLRDASGLNWIGRYEEARSSLDLGIYPAVVRQRSPVSWVPGAFLIARVDALDEGFSPDMREGEDVDFVWKLADRGWRIRFEPEASVWHEHRHTVRDWLGRKVFYGSSAHPLALRHPRDIAPAVFSPWTLGVVGALIAQRRWSVPVALGISGFAAIRIARKLVRSEHPLSVAASLTAAGVSASLTQTMALAVRHWWPLALLLSIFSRRARRVVVVSAVVDAVLEYRRTKPDLDPFRFAIARRLDDLAYGFGVWKSAFRGRSLAALLPDVRRRD